tara:strand:+ start:114 stop:281 length:168 start_codon:yes stop_codon:yes gene_type:complete
MWIEVLSDADDDVFDAETVVPLIQEAMRENFVFRRDVVKVDVRISYHPGRGRDDV